jgi:hypothetical protein
MLSSRRVRLAVAGAAATLAVAAPTHAASKPVYNLAGGCYSVAPLQGDGKITFEREQTGTRTFDLNTDGVAHYGLLADLVADVGQTSARRALPVLFRSAEAYLRTWQRAMRRR